MRKTSFALLGFMLFFACAQTPAKNETTPDNASSGTSVSSRPQQQKRVFFYRVEASSQMAGFNILVNGTEMHISEGAKPSELKTDINDWMISGNNEISFTVFWPDNVKFVPGTAPASFKLFSNDTLIKEFTWPVAGIPDQASSYPHTITEIFKADGFPKVALERAERVISSAGVLPKSDQEVIASMATELRKAFEKKDIALINELLISKYADLAVARFTTAAAIREEISNQYLELMEKENYTVRPHSWRFSYSSTADDRVVRITQGRIGFPEAALVITWKEKGVTRRFDQELYFSKIDGKWVIIR